MRQQDDLQRVDLQGYLDAVRRRKRTVAIIALAAVGITVALTLRQTPIYEGKARVLVLPRSAESVFSGPQSRTALGTVETEIEVLRSDPVRTRVNDRLEAAPTVSGRQIGDTDIMQIVARDKSRRRAADVANAYADSYVELRKSEAIAELTTAAQGIRDKIRALQEEADGFEKRIAQAPASERSAVEAAVRPRYTNVLTQQSSLSQKLDQVEVDMALKSGGARVVSIAEPADKPVTPKPIRNLIAALVMGILSGAGVAYLQEALDDSVRSKDELARITGLPVLGVIPPVPDWSAKTTRKSPLGESGFEALEAFRRLRTSVQLLGVDRPVETLQFTSPNPGEGKTSLILALGAVLAQAGQRVVVVDCDLRRPQLHSISGLTNEAGFTTVFHNKMLVHEAVRPVTDAYPLYALTSGPLPANPSELLGSKRTAEVIFELQGDFDMVLVDSPPVLPVTDATLLAGWAEATLVVAKAGVTTKRQLVEAVDQLKVVDAKLLGAILNHASPEIAYGYGYSYNYYQSP